MEKPAVWQMIKEAIEALNGRANYPAIKEYINDKWDDVNQATINAQLIVLSVNQPSRVQYTMNKKPRISNSQYDILFSIGPGQVVANNPNEHGIWEIYKNEYDAPAIRQVISDIQEDNEQEIEEPGDGSFLFPIEANLRDFLIQNLSTFREKKLKLHTDEFGRDGKEYRTEVGIIDILTTDEGGNFFIFELKLSRGADRALGQLLRYMGWVKKNLAKGKKVSGIIVANKMDEKIKYAVLVTQDVTLYEYEMKFELSKPKAL